MNSKKILLLSVISFCTANAQDDVKKNIARTVGGVASAATLVGVETLYRRFITWKNYGSDVSFYPAGPMGVTNTAERLARNKFVSFFGWWSLDSRGKEQIKAQIRESQDIINPVADLYTTHEQKETFMRKQLPKIFIRYAFCRNLVLIWGAMHCYNVYHATKCKKA